LFGTHRAKQVEEILDHRSGGTRTSRRDIELTGKGALFSSNGSRAPFF
jgi:hypothetical protein